MQIHLQQVAMQTWTYPFFCWGNNDILVLLWDQQACAVRWLEHIDDQVIGQDVQLLHLITRHIGLASNALPAEMQWGHETPSWCVPYSSASDGHRICIMSYWLSAEKHSSKGLHHLLLLPAMRACIMLHLSLQRTWEIAWDIWHKTLTLTSCPLLLDLEITFLYSVNRLKTNNTVTPHPCRVIFTICFCLNLSSIILTRGNWMFFFYLSYTRWVCCAQNLTLPDIKWVYATLYDCWNTKTDLKYTKQN